MCDRTEMSTKWLTVREDEEGVQKAWPCWMVLVGFRQHDLKWDLFHCSEVSNACDQAYGKDGLMGDAWASPKYTFLSSLLIHLEFVLRHLQQAGTSLMSEVFKPNFYEQNNSLNEESKQKNRAVCQGVSLPLWKASAKSDRHMFIMSPVGRSRVGLQCRRVSDKKHRIHWFVVRRERKEMRIKVGFAFLQLWVICHAPWWPTSLRFWYAEGMLLWRRVRSVLWYLCMPFSLSKSKTCGQHLERRVIVQILVLGFF